MSEKPEMMPVLSYLCLRGQHFEEFGNQIAIPQPRPGLSVHGLGRFFMAMNKQVSRWYQEDRYDH